MAPPLSVNIFQAVSNVGLVRQFAKGRYAAVPHPAMLAVGPRAVENHVCFFDSLSPLAVANEQVKRPIATFRVSLQKTLASNIDHLGIGSNGF